jgi:inhibitor of cysteine peptidase
VVSSLTGIAPTERIYSARYSGSRLYLVTFRRVDPFFVIEFDAHHLNPKILGEVKITGYSSYLHLYDETTIIGIGKEVVEENGSLVTNGVKFSIFNVSDPSNPIVADTDHLTDRRITSLAVQEHKAFFFSK